MDDKETERDGATKEELLDVFIKQIRCILEFAAPAWHGAITQGERTNIERVQKAALHIILGENYSSYKDALKLTNLESLDIRREQMCLVFAKKCEKQPKLKHWFKLNHKAIDTRGTITKYCEVTANRRRYENSAISYLTHLLNKHYQE